MYATYARMYAHVWECMYMYVKLYSFSAAVKIAPERPVSLASRSWEQSALTTVAPSLVACRMSGECTDRIVTKTTGKFVTQPTERHVTRASRKSALTWTSSLIQVRMFTSKTDKSE